MRSWLIIIVIIFELFPLKISSQTAYQTSIQQQRKIALIIGNGSYIKSVLANPENDARAMKVALQNVGFTVMEYENLNQSQMKKAIDDFGMRLKSNEVGLFYYAGHGIQSKGYNYLIPVDAELQSEQQVEYDCVQADRVLALMEASGAKVNIIILDACRNNPFERSWTRSATGRGLAFMNAPRGSLIAYATSPGSTASDGSGNNGLYTSAILESIQIPNLTIIQMFQNVRNIVAQKSNNQQTPWESTSLTGDFYFIPINIKPEISKESVNNISSANNLSVEKGNIREDQKMDAEEKSRLSQFLGKDAVKILYDDNNKHKIGNNTKNINNTSEKEKNTVYSSIPVPPAPADNNKIATNIVILFNLPGRQAYYLPKPEINYSGGKIIEVPVLVDRDGNVVVDDHGKVVDSWVTNKNGTVFEVDGKVFQVNNSNDLSRENTTTDQNLKDFAYGAASKARFNPKPRAPKYQPGSITYWFIKR